MEGIELGLLDFFQVEEGGLPPENDVEKQSNPR
jgi:hypothetical protein